MTTTGVARIAANAPAAGEPWPLPETWCWAKMDRVATVNPATNFDALDPASKIPFVPMAAVSEESGEIDFSVRRPVQEVTKGYVRFKEGDVIFAKITPCMENGKVAPVVGLPGGYAAGSTEFHVFRPAAADQRYLWYWLVSRGFRGRAKRNMSGSAGQLRVPVDWLREADFPIAPLPEQRRIVARVDQLFAEIADGEAALAAVRKGLDIFRRGLLKAAVTGELTKDWRAANPVSESGHALLARIVKNDARETVTGRARGATEESPLDSTTLPALPKGWAWANLGNMVVEMEYGTSEKCDFAFKGVPVLRMGNVNFGNLNYTKLKYAPAGIDVPTLRDGDLIFNRTNSAELVGKSAVYRSEVSPCSLASYLIRVRFEGVPPEFVAAWINSPYGRAWITSNKSQQVGQANLSGGTLKKMPIPIPPPAEADEILRRVSDAIAARADTLAMLDAEAADAARLKQSILKAAFEGRLVPQDPADEPAGALLARLAAPALATGRQGRRKTRQIRLESQ